MGQINLILWNTDSLGDPIIPAPVIVHEPATTNVFLNSDAPATQNINLTVGTWTTSILGTGSITTSAGTATATGYGAATEGADNTIEVTGAGTVTFTKAGTVTFTQVENKAFSTPIVKTTGASASRDIVDLYAPLLGNFGPNKGTVTVVFTANQASTALGTTESIFSVDGTDILQFGATDGLFTVTDGTNSVSLTQTWNAGDKLAVGVSYSGSTMVLHVRNITQDNTQHSAETAFDGSFPTGTNIELMNDNPNSFQIHEVPIWSGPRTNAQWEVDHAA